MQIGALSQAEHILVGAMLQGLRVHVEKALCVCESAQLDEARRPAGRTDEEVALFHFGPVGEGEQLPRVVNLGQRVVPAVVNVELVVPLPDDFVLLINRVETLSLRKFGPEVESLGARVDFEGVSAYLVTGG